MSEKGELDLTGVKQNTGMWLVKVPKYLSQQWSKASGRGEVGKLRIVKNQGRTEVSFTLNEELASISGIGGKPASVSAPREHPFLLQSVGGQILTVFTESYTESQPEEKSESSGYDKLSLEGIVVQRAECRPAASENYMRLKREKCKPGNFGRRMNDADLVSECSKSKKQSVQGTFGRCVEGHGLARTIGDGWMVGLDDVVGLFQP